MALCGEVEINHLDKKELDAAIADTHGGGRPLIDVVTVQEIIRQILTLEHRPDISFTKRRSIWKP